MAQLKVTQVKSKIGGNSSSATRCARWVCAIGQSSVKPDRPEFRGMIHTVRHLVPVEEVD